jgi:hypothetical protein
MIREVNLVSYLPPYLQNYKEQVAALEAEDPEFLLVWDAVNGILYNHFISTANEYGISRYEKLLGIKPTEDDNLESRRSRVQVQWVNLVPYTIRTFLQKMNVLCGDTSYIVSGNFRESYDLTVITHLENVGQVDELNNLFQGILPMNIVVDSKNEIPVNTSTGSFFSGRMTTHVDLILTQDWCGTLKTNSASVFVGYPSDTARVTITQDFNEKSVISGDAKTASGVTYTDVIRI